MRSLVFLGGSGEGLGKKMGELNISGWGWYPGGHYVVFSRTQVRFWCALLTSI